MCHQWYMNEYVNTWHWQNDSESVQPKYWRAKTVQCHFVHCTSIIDYARIGCGPPLWEDGNCLSVLCLKNMPYCLYICLLQIECDSARAKTRFHLSIRWISPCRIRRAGTAVSLAPQLLLIFCASHILSIQQAQYLADGNVSKVTCFPEILAQVPKSLYSQCLLVTGICKVLSDVCLRLTHLGLSTSPTSPCDTWCGWQFSWLLAAEVCAHQLLMLLCWIGYVLQSCGVYWIPTPVASFLFTAPPMEPYVPSHTNRTVAYFIWRIAAVICMSTLCVQSLIIFSYYIHGKSIIVQWIFAEWVTFKECICCNTRNWYANV
jgi:hypothetical protein